MNTKVINYRSVIDQEILVGKFTDFENAKVLVVFLHGMAEHKERYIDFVQDLAKKNINSLIVDHRGHGESLYQGKIKGYFADHLGWYTNTQDIKDMVDFVNTKHLPVVLMGHSMGSLFARSYLKHYPENIKAVFLSGSPDIAPTASVAKYLAQLISLIKNPFYISTFLNNQVFKAFNKSISNPKTDFDWLSYNHANVLTYINDPLCGFMFTTKAMEDLAVGLMDVYKKEKWNVLDRAIPIHFISGQDDVTHRPKGLEFAVKRLNQQGYTNVSYEYVKDARHEIFHELIADHLRQDFIAWIKLKFEI